MGTTVVSLIVAIACILYLGMQLFRLRRENRKIAERIVEVDQMKKTFISHVSHELKAPLASMQETTHVLLEEIPGPLTDKQKRLLSLNLQSGKRLAQMIGNILDLSRLEAGIVEYDMQAADIAGLTHSVVLEVSGKAREKHLRILTNIQQDPLLVECDPNRMVQVLTNLLENAVRFSQKEGLIRVEVRTLDQPPHMPQSARLNLRAARKTPSAFALIGISDSSPGIDDSQKETIFHSFHQGKQGKRSHGESLGLGLAISRAVVEAHRGAIWIEDQPGGGSVFFVLLPAASEKQSMAEAV